MVASPEFKALVKKRWRVSLGLLALLFVSYYGYVLVIASNKAFVSLKVDGATTLAIPLGIAVIVFAWVLTAVYVGWANRSYDPEVERLRSELRPLAGASRQAGDTTIRVPRHPRFVHRLLLPDRGADPRRHLLGGAAHQDLLGVLRGRALASRRSRTAWPWPATTCRPRRSWASPAWWPSRATMA